ncbi:hypothetical protein BDM02DRAFT_3117613 [Thelephora ganbajun]|uniref:Uncharacterized protein n=1 Tax=Thelephora ganbajun TaxID=370292 RepID=A0ACB6ZC61_THEGA|nr:hypothetical protein BDM02DRAFT_3117613 [Thelephora ganbajun]
MPASYPGFPGGFVPDSQMTSGQMPQGPMGAYPVVPGGVIPSETETSEGSPVIPPRPQHWVTGEQDVGVIPPMPELVHRPPQPYVHRPGPPPSESDEGPIVMPAPPPVVVQPAETTQTVPIIVPPPGVARPLSPSRESSLSSSSSSSTPRHTIPSGVERIPYRRGRPRSGRTSPSRSSVSSRTPPPGPATIINVTAPQPATAVPPEGVVGPPGPPINIVAPSTPSVRREHALTQAQLPPIIIQPPVWLPQQQLQPVPPIVTTVHEPEMRRRGRRRYSISSSSSSLSPSSRMARSRSRERRRRRSYTPTRRQRRSRSRSYSPSRRYTSRYYSPSRRSRSRTPTRPSIPGQGVTVLPVPTVPSHYAPPPSTTSPSQVQPHPAGQIFIQPAPPPGIPGVVQPGFIQPGVLQPSSTAFVYSSRAHVHSSDLNP